MTSPAASERITISDIMAVVKIDWEKLAAKAGFRDAAAAKAHYGTLLEKPQRKAAHDAEDASEVKTEDPVAKRSEIKTGFKDTYAHSWHINGMEDGET